MPAVRAVRARRGSTAGRAPDSRRRDTGSSRGSAPRRTAGQRRPAAQAAHPAVETAAPDSAGGRVDSAEDFVRHVLSSVDAEHLHTQRRGQRTDRERQSEVGSGVHGFERFVRRSLGADVSRARWALEAADRFRQQQFRQPEDDIRETRRQGRSSGRIRHRAATSRGPFAVNPDSVPIATILVP